MLVPAALLDVADLSPLFPSCPRRVRSTAPIFKGAARSRPKVREVSVVTKWRDGIRLTDAWATTSAPKGGVTSS